MWKREKEIAVIKENRRVPRWKAVEILDGVQETYSKVTYKNVYPTTTNQPPNTDNKLQSLLEASNKEWDKRFNELSERANQLINLVESQVHHQSPSIHHQLGNTPQRNFAYTTPVRHHLSDLNCVYTKPQPVMEQNVSDHAELSSDTEEKDSDKDGDKVQDKAHIQKRKRRKPMSQTFDPT